MQGIFDIHTHAFPDAIADRAIRMLEEEADIEAFLDGRISSLLESMDRAGIAASVVCPVATKPDQFDPILEWGREIRSDRIVPLLSVHPEDADPAERLRRGREEGFPGIKMHPYYQGFKVDDEKALPVYEALCREGLILAMHTGYDIAFGDEERAAPARLRRIRDRFPELKLVATHFGGWKDWKAAREQIIGTEMYVEISVSLEYMDPGEAREMILAHPKEYMLFGTDSPWGDQKDTLDRLRALDLGEERENLMLRENPRRLLGLV